MATMVAPGNSQLSSSLPVQDKGHCNKRKFRTDSPLPDPNNLIQPQNEYPTYDFPTEKSSHDFTAQQHGGVCDLCTSLTCLPGDELDIADYLDADWTDSTEAELEDLALKSLDLIFKTAIMKISSHGFIEELATKAVLRSGICYGSKDTVSNIVDNALALLGNGKDIDSSREHLFEDLQLLEKYLLAEMVCVLRENRPFFSTGDAMWCLLVCDMNVSLACGMDRDLGSGEAACSSSVSQLKQEHNSSTAGSSSNCELNASRASQLNLPTPSQIAPQTLMPPVAGIPNLPSVRPPSTSNTHATMSNLNSGKENQLSSSDCIAEEFSCTSVSQSYTPEEKLVNGKKSHGGTSKRESALRQKSAHLEKSYRAYKSKGTIRAGKLSTLGSLILDKKCRSSSDSTGINLKGASIKKNKSGGVEVFQGDGNPTLSFSAGGTSGLTFSSKTANTLPPLPTANTELSLSTLSINKSSRSNSSTNAKPNTNIVGIQNYSGMQPDKIGGQWVPQDKKDEMMLTLVPRVRELQAQLQEWTEWAQQKVMQAARRLKKDKTEFQALRQEKEEVSRLTKEKHTLEESTMKKLTEMESALLKASSQVEKANATSRSLEVENALLRLEMEAAKLRAAESAATCQEVSRREMKTMKDSQSWEREKAIFREELMTEKRKCSQMEQQLEQAMTHLGQFQDRLKRDSNMKEEVLVEASFVRKQHEQAETFSKSKKDTLTSEAERNKQTYKEDIKKIESEISEFRLKNSFSKVAALMLSLDGRNCTLKNNAHEMIISQEPGFGDVQREHECVMCLTEEISIVFLPCSHQVVCGICNELHEKQGMKDCPSCRTPIQRRIPGRRVDRDHS